MTDHGSDPNIRRIREEISDVDRAIIEAVNARLALVARLKRYKEENGIPFLDPERERALVDELTRMNPGPLSPEGVRDLYRGLLDLTKRELT
jgi:chorismate mutase